MAKAKKKSVKKATEKPATKKSSTTRKVAPVEREEVEMARPDTPTSETPTPEKGARARAGAKERTRDPRLPTPGTVIRKVDRHGATRCEVKVLEDGFEYKGQTFRTISGVARAAAADLGLQNRAVNGLVFFGGIRMKNARTFRISLTRIG